MTNEQRIALRLSEVRQRLNTLAGQETLTGEESSEIEKLSNEFNTLETQYRAAVLASENDTGKQDPPKDNFQQLADRVEVRSFLNEALTGAIVDGAGKEMRDELKCPAGYMPWGVLLPTVEERADVATQAPTVVGAVQHTILPRIFSQSVGAFLGVGFPMVDAGEQVFTVLSAGATPTQAAQGADVDATAATFTPTKLTPKRLTMRYTFQVEDAAVLMGEEAALRADIREAISNRMDYLVLNGNGTAPQPTGLLQALTDPAAPQASDNTFQKFLNNVTASVDGIYASSIQSVRLVCGPATYQAYASTFITNDAVSATDYLIQRSGGLRVTDHLPAPASHAQPGLTFAAMTQGAAVAPVWGSGMRLIVDEVTGAKAGEVALTGLTLWDFAAIRTAAYKQRAFRTP